MEESRGRGQMELPMLSVQPQKATTSLPMALSAREDCVTLLAQMMKSILLAERKREVGHE